MNRRIDITATIEDPNQNKGSSVVKINGNILPSVIEWHIDFECGRSSPILTMKGLLEPGVKVNIDGKDQS